MRAKVALGSRRVICGCAEQQRCTYSQAPPSLSRERFNELELNGGQWNGCGKGDRDSGPRNRQDLGIGVTTMSSQNQLQEEDLFGGSRSAETLLWNKVVRLLAVN
jgi:hypothetical protein